MLGSVSLPQNSLFKKENCARCWWHTPVIYSGGRDQVDCSLKPAQANSLLDPILIKLTTKRAGGVAQGVGPEFRSQYYKKRKKIEVFFDGYLTGEMCQMSGWRWMAHLSLS
jgi:hypothetical protein